MIVTRASAAFRWRSQSHNIRVWRSMPMSSNISRSSRYNLHRLLSLQPRQHRNEARSGGRYTTIRKQLRRKWTTLQSLRSQHPVRLRSPLSHPRRLALLGCSSRPLHFPRERFPWRRRSAQLMRWDTQRCARARQRRVRVRLTSVSFGHHRCAHRHPAALLSHQRQSRGISARKRKATPPRAHIPPRVNRRSVNCS